MGFNLKSEDSEKRGEGEIVRMSQGWERNAEHCMFAFLWGKCSGFVSWAMKAKNKLH